MESIRRPSETIKTGNVMLNREAIIERIIHILQLEIKRQKQKIEALESALKKLTQ